MFYPFWGREVNVPGTFLFSEWSCSRRRCITEVTSAFMVGLWAGRLGTGCIQVSLSLRLLLWSEV